jgi:diguanylate cyclase (GGDEF)-like protein
MFSACTAVIAIVLTAIFTNVFPACYVKGIGLTPFKKISEYIISGMVLSSIATVIYKRSFFGRDLLRWLVASLALTIGSELAFTFYVGVYDLSNLVGHFFKLIAFYLIYIAIIEMRLEKSRRLLLKNLQRNEKALQKALKDVQHLTITDPLTGLYNQRHFPKLAEAELQRTCRYGHPLSAIMLDIGRFKRVNDTYGHTVGDHMLQEVAESCLQEVRGMDVVGRYGGDEFVILLPEGDLDAARKIAGPLRKDIARIHLHTAKGPARVSASLGVASVDCKNLTLEDILNRTDKALYTAKRRGRNRVSIG